MTNRLSFHYKIMIIQIIFILIIMIVTGIYSYKSNLSNEMKEITIQNEQLMKRLISNLSSYAANFDDKNCDNLLSQEINDKNILAIVINQNNTLFKGKIKSEKGEIKDIENIKNYKIDLDKSYLVKKEKIIFKDTGEDSETGELQLYFTDNHIKAKLSGFLIQIIIQSLIIIIALSVIIYISLNKFLYRPLQEMTKTAGAVNEGKEIFIEDGGSSEFNLLSDALNNMIAQFRIKAGRFKKTTEMLTVIMRKVREITANLNSSSRQIESAAQEQTSATSEHASGITEVSATLEELTITAKQITKNVGELVLSDEDVQKLLDESEKQLLQTVSQLDEVGKISAKNSSEIAELGKRSVLINDMVKIIKEIANKTKMLSINASIEAAKNKESGAGFSVIATEIGELSQETIGSTKNVQKAAKEIQAFLNSIIKSSEIESQKVNKSALIAKEIFSNIETIVGKIKNNYTFTQKIDVSIKQQENGSRQAADTMKQMAEISRQSAETARETSLAINNIVKFSTELDNLINSCNPEEGIEKIENNIIIKNKLRENKSVMRKILGRILHPGINPSYKKKEASINLQNYLKPLIHILRVFILEQLPTYLSVVSGRIKKLFNLLKIKIIKIKNLKLHNKKKKE